MHLNILFYSSHIDRLSCRILIAFPFFSSHFFRVALTSAGVLRTAVLDLLSRSCVELLAVVDRRVLRNLVNNLGERVQALNGQGVETRLQVQRRTAQRLLVLVVELGHHRLTTSHQLLWRAR